MNKKRLYTIQEALTAFKETFEFAEENGGKCDCSTDIFQDRLMRQYPEEKKCPKSK